MGVGMGHHRRSLSRVSRLGGPAALLAAGMMVVAAVPAAASASSSRLAGGSGRAAAAAAAAAGIWGKAIEVPGTAVLNASGSASALSVSCPSAGNCGAGGYYRDGASHLQAFVVSQRSGKWGKALEVPGTAGLNAGGNAQTSWVSCPSAGNCVAGGSYTDGAHHSQAFVASQRSGKWGKALEVPGTAGLNAGGNALIFAVSCPSAGNCGAAGSYTDGAGHSQAFVVSQRSGKWGKAIEVPGTAGLNVGGSATINSVSCVSAGNCGAGGSYMDGVGHIQAFVVSQRSGKWGKAIEVPGTAGLNAGGNAAIGSVSCPSAGNCGAAGIYMDGASHNQAFVVSQRSGKWGKAIEVPGTAGLNAGGNAGTNSVSCPSAGNCGAGGAYEDGTGHFQAFVVSQRSGKWGKALEVPGTAVLNAGGNAQVLAVSCPSAGSCGAAGLYLGGAGFEAFVVSQRSGKWGKALEVPGTAGLNVGGEARTLSVSCPSAGECTASGDYLDASFHFQAFVVSQT